MTQGDSREDTDQPQLFDRKAFRKVALRALVELQALVQKHLASDTLEELQMKSVWGHKLPSFKNDALSILFDEFPLVADSFDFKATGDELCTSANLAELTKACGPRRVTRAFQQFFESRAFQEWRILIPLENVHVREPGKMISKDVVQLRPLKNEEREQLSMLLPAYKANGLFFSVSVQAGDDESAVARARRRIEVFLAPYYLHRARNPDAWWRARTLRQIVSPFAFYSNPKGLFGARRELRQLPTEATDLFKPDPGIEPEWKEAVERLATSWSQPKIADDPIGERLQLCSRWMFSAESDELPENAFLKHAIAWEALMPSKAERLLRCWYLLLLCLGTAEPRCVKTVSQASRLVDRRNSFAHPEINRELYGTVENDLTRLKQSVWWGFDEALRLWQSPGGQATEWPKLLADCYKAIRSDDRPKDYDKSVYLMLDRLLYIEEDDFGKPVLSRDGQSLRVEAQITRARQLWPSDKNPKESAAELARALQVATDEKLPPYEYHALLSIEEREATMDRTIFEDGWHQAGVATTPPTAQEIAQRIGEIELNSGATREDVGWKK